MLSFFEIGVSMPCLCGQSQVGPAGWPYLIGSNCVGIVSKLRGLLGRGPRTRNPREPTGRKVNSSSGSEFLIPPFEVFAVGFQRNCKIQFASFRKQTSHRRSTTRERNSHFFRQSTRANDPTQTFVISASNNPKDRVSPFLSDPSSSSLFPTRRLSPMFGVRLHVDDDKVILALSYDNVWTDQSFHRPAGMDQ